MIPDRLFELALKYKKTKLWKKLWDTQMFGVRFSDGEIGYCCVMGMAGELNAIAVYPGQQGLDSLRTLHDDPSSMDDLARLERMHDQDCMTLSFMNKSELPRRDLEAISAYCDAHGISLHGRKAYPHFERLNEGSVPWYLEDEQDQRRMTEALEGILEVADRLTREMRLPEALGFTEDPPYDHDIPLVVPENGGFRWESHALPPREKRHWPPIVIDDDLSRVRLERAPRKSEWALKLFRHILPSTSQEEDDPISYDDLESQPFFPWLMLIVDTHSGLVLSAWLSSAPTDYTAEFAPKLTELVSNSGMPNSIVVLDDRTEEAIRDFCDRFGVRLKRKNSCKQLQSALDDFIAHFLDADDPEDYMEGPDEVLEALRDPEFVAGMPDEMIRSFLTEVDMNEMPEDIGRIMVKEAMRRGIIRK